LSSFHSDKHAKAELCPYLQL